MGCVRVVDVLAMCLLVVAGAWGYDMDLATLLKNHNQAKRKYDAGNPCPEPEKPFPCKGDKTCIPLKYVCDSNPDCDDGYDENSEVCTAFHRPPVIDIYHFLDSEKKWIMPKLFGNKPISKVAHGLAVSKTVDDFQRRLGLSNKDTNKLRDALMAVEVGDEDLMKDLGMPSSAWSETYFILKKLVKSGFQ